MATENSARAIYQWSNPAPAENLEASECKSSWKAKKLEVVASAEAERSDQSRELWRFVSVASHKIRLQIEKSPFPDTVPGLHHKKPAEVRLDKKDVIEIETE